jgi:hypothetical protein
VAECAGAHYRAAMVETAPSLRQISPLAHSLSGRGENRALLIAQSAFLRGCARVGAHGSARLFPQRLFPPLEDVATTLVRLTVAGILPHHVLTR